MKPLKLLHLDISEKIGILFAGNANYFVIFVAYSTAASALNFPKDKKDVLDA